MISTRDIRTIKEHKVNKTLSVNLPKSKGFEAGQTVLVVVIDEYLDELTAVVIDESKADKKEKLDPLLSAEADIKNPELMERLNKDANDIRLAQHLKGECFKCPLCGREHFTNLESLDKCKGCGTPRA